MIYKPTKPYSEDLNDLIEETELVKAKALPLGSVRNWSGTSYTKVSEDEWKPIAHAKNEVKVEERPKEHTSDATTDHERSALKEYQSGIHDSALGGYANIQSHLRTGKAKYGIFTPEQEKLSGEVADHISSVIKKHPVKKPTTVYRGMRVTKNSPETEKYASLKVGDTFQDKGFTSTSTDRKIADSFKEKLSFKDQPILIEVALKEGDHALPMNEYHKSSEKEILLDRNTKFKVVSVSESKGIKKIKVEIDSKESK